eukprot:10820369-Alexandrium_andersonii.AAC.1
MPFQAFLGAFQRLLVLSSVGVLPKKRLKLPEAALCLSKGVLVVCSWRPGASRIKAVRAVGWVGAAGASPPSRGATGV